MDIKPTILLVEDNEEDAFIAQRALRLAKIECSVQIAEHGEAAIDYLAGRGKYADRMLHPIPVLMLLDLKMPYLNGFEVLAWIATQPELRSMRTIILTSSGEERDRDRAEQFGIKLYFLKPPTPQLMVTIAKELEASCSRIAE